MRLVSYLSPGFPESLFELLGEVVGARVDFERERSGPVLDDDPFADGRADLGWICSTSYVDLALRKPTPTVQLAGVAWVPDDPDAAGRPVYFGDVVVPARSPIRDVDDLVGQRVGVNDPVSLSGHWALRIELARRGLDPDGDVDLSFTGGHHASLDAVALGALDAAVVDSVVRIGRARHDPAVAALRIVARLGPWPVQPLVARSTLGPETVDGVRDRLLAADDRPEIRSALRSAALDRLVPVGSDHYEPVHRAMTGPAEIPAG